MDWWIYKLILWLKEWLINMREILIISNENFWK